jgi:DNA-binding XRE family transcriptional regulator
VTSREFAELRNVLGLTQAEMAHGLGLSRGSLARLEGSEELIPKRYELAARRVADVFFFEHAPEEYVELVEELKWRLREGKGAGVLVTDLYELLGAHRHTCGDCSRRFWCFCAYPAQAHLCRDCERAVVEKQEAAIEVA